MIEVSAAVTPQELEAVGRLMLAHAVALRTHAAASEVRAEAEQLPGPYRRPRGRLYLAWQDGRPIGCVALRPLGPAVAEVKRLFVLPAARGLGAGRALMSALLDDARRLGYKRLRLGTLEDMTAAQRLYTLLGFVEIPNYQGVGGVDDRFFELRLDTTAPP